MLRRELPMAMHMIGTWEIVSSSDFDDEYLNMEGTPYVRLHQDGDRVVGEYHLGCSPAAWMVAHSLTAPYCSASKAWMKQTKSTAPEPPR
jgi:hypothetical protein